MLTLLLMAGLAFAQDPVDPDAPIIADGIQLIPAGSLLVLPGDEPTKQTIIGKSFLLPEFHYNTALAKSRQLDICQPALDTCTDKALEMRAQCSERLTSCLGQFDADEEFVNELLAERNQFETRALVAETALKDARRDKWVAWAITGGVVLGATTVTVVTLSN